MAVRTDIVDRGRHFSDQGSCYSWNWEWMLDRDFVLSLRGRRNSSAGMDNGSVN